MERLDHILVVDDDSEIRDLLRTVLERQGFRASVAANGRQMRALLADGDVDLVVLDLMLPGEDGLQICSALHAGGNPPPILMLTARNEEIDRVLGLEMGADDYLGKPFATRELVARVRAILRRGRSANATASAAADAAVASAAATVAAAAAARALPPRPRTLSFGPWRLDTHARHLLDEDNVMVSLSTAEYRLLQTFLDHPQRVLTRDQLLELTQGRESDSFDRSIDILVSRLRKRLRDDSREAAYIRTVRNGGYMFTSPVQPA